MDEKQLGKCPKCGSDLYGYKHTPCGDHPELEQEHIECINPNCNYEQN